MGIKSVVLAAFGLFSLQVSAATVTFEYDVSFGSVTPDGPSPYATAVITDTAVNTVQLTMSVAASVDQGDVTQMYFNVDPLTSLTFNCDSGECADNISTGLNAFKADGDGSYDLLFDWDPSGQLSRLNAGESAVYTISGIGLDANDFAAWSQPPTGGNGPYMSVARFQDTGPTQEGSDWVGAVPVPAAVWLFGSGLIGLIGVARRKA